MAKHDPFQPGEYETPAPSSPSTEGPLSEGDDAREREREFIEEPRSSNEETRRTSEENSTDGKRLDDEFFVSDAIGAPMLTDNPAPLSSALGIPTVLDSSTPPRGPNEGSASNHPAGLADPNLLVSDRLGVPLLIRDKDVSPRLRAAAAHKAEGEDRDEDYLPSKAFKYPLLSDNPAPLSSALGLPTIVEDPDGGQIRHTDSKGREHPPGIIDPDFSVSGALGLPLIVDDPTPLSSAAGISTLSNEKADTQKGSPFFRSLSSSFRPKYSAPRDPSDSDRPFGAGVASRQLGSSSRRPLMENAPPRPDHSDVRLPGSGSPTKLQRNEIVAGILAALVVLGPLLPWGR